MMRVRGVAPTFFTLGRTSSGFAVSQVHGPRICYKAKF